MSQCWCCSKRSSPVRLSRLLTSQSLSWNSRPGISSSADGGGEMSGKRLIISGAAISTLLVIALVAYWPTKPQTPDVTKENIEKLNPRMTEEDVEKLLGRKSSDGAYYDKAEDGWVIVRIEAGRVAGYRYRMPGA